MCRSILCFSHLISDASYLFLGDETPYFHILVKVVQSKSKFFRQIILCTFLQFSASSKSTPCLPSIDNIRKMLNQCHSKVHKKFNWGKLCSEKITLDMKISNERIRTNKKDLLKILANYCTVLFILIIFMQFVQKKTKVLSLESVE